MKISIVTTTYNSAKTVRDTLDSVISQTYQDWELIIVDGCSTDHTLEIVREYQEKAPGKIFCKSEKDNGIYDAFNKGIERCTGDIIGILNSDDIYASEESLELIATTFTKKNTDCVFGNLLMVMANETNKVFREWNGRPYPPKGFLKGWHPAHPTFYCKRSCYERYGLYDTSYRIASDFELMLRFIEKNGISTHFINEHLVKMRMGGASTSSIHNILIGRKDILRAFKENGYKINSFTYYIKRITPKILNILTTKVNKMYND